VDVGVAGYLLGLRRMTFADGPVAELSLWWQIVRNPVLVRAVGGFIDSDATWGRTYTAGISIGDTTTQVKL